MKGTIQELRIKSLRQGKGSGRKTPSYSLPKKCVEGSSLIDCRVSLAQFPKIPRKEMEGLDRSSRKEKKLNRWMKKRVRGKKGKEKKG